MNHTEERLAIYELVARYNMAWDAQDPGGVSGCFTPDGVFVDAAGTEHAGSEAIERFVRASDAQFGRMRHITSTHLVSFSDDRSAVHRCYVIFVSHPGQERVLDTGEYEDHLERVSGDWRFRRRIVRFD
jgi:uncharacterized protein (TIGR02246 family)